MQYKFPMTLDRQFKNKLEELHDKYGTEMMEIEGMSPEQLDTCKFFKEFLNTDTVADATTDDNANVTDKNINTMQKEANKPFTRLLSRNKLYIELKEEFGKEVADDYLESVVSGELYEHDSYDSSYKPYCYSFSLKKIVEKGLYFLKEMKAGRPKHWDTFNHHTLEFIVVIQIFPF
jgi:ribonucleoside-triphosphate reductase